MYFRSVRQIVCFTQPSVHNFKVFQLIAITLSLRYSIWKEDIFTGKKMRGRGPSRTFTLLPLKISPTTPSLSQTSWINSKFHNRCCYVQLTIIQKIQPGSVYLDSYGVIFLLFTTQILGFSKKKKRKKKLRRFNQNIQLNARYIYMLFFSF